MPPFLPHADAPTNGPLSSTSALVALPRVGGNVAVRIAWQDGPGYISFVQSGGSVDSSTGMLLPFCDGVEVLRVPPTATHLAYIDCAVNLVAGDGL